MCIIVSILVATDILPLQRQICCFLFGAATIYENFTAKLELWSAPFGAVYSKNQRTVEPSAVSALHLFSALK